AIPAFAASLTVIRPEVMNELLSSVVLGAVFIVTRNLWITIGTGALGILTQITLGSGGLMKVFLTCAVFVSGGFGTKVSPRSVILKPKHAHYIVNDRRGSDFADKISGTWTPTADDIRELEKRLPEFLSKMALRYDKPALQNHDPLTDYKQYVGIIIDER